MEIVYLIKKKMNKIKIWIGTFGRALLVEKCKEMGIYQGNAVFFYSGDTRHIVEDEIFNQLVYVGQYEL